MNISAMAIVRKNKLLPAAFPTAAVFSEAANYKV